jgi:hypothetical protein
MLCMLIHHLVLAGLHMKQASHRVQLGEHCRRRYYFFYAQLVQWLQSEDNRCHQLNQWLLHRTVDGSDILCHIFWTDEATFVRSGVNSLHNYMNGHCRLLLDTLHFSNDFASMFRL